MWGLAKMVSLKVAALPFFWLQGDLYWKPKLAMGNQYGGPVNIIHCSFISGSISSAATRGGEANTDDCFRMNRETPEFAYHISQGRFPIG